jgi:acyl phosphate:glycerol-3-phosphate acyltransferase
MMWSIPVLWGGSFLLGAIPFGLVIARLHSGVDLRRTGSGNIGATNVARTLGIKYGMLALILDMAKGFLPAWGACHFYAGETALVPFEAAGAGLAAFLGHVYSPFLHFKGGKGVATTLGVLLAIMPAVLIPALAIFLVVVAVTGFVSAGSLAATLIMPPAAYVLGYSFWAWGMALIVAVVIFIRHRENIGRLRRGEENKWSRTG